MTDTPPIPELPHLPELPAPPQLPELPTDVPPRQLVADLAASVRECGRELGAVRQYLTTGAEAATRQAEQHAATAALWLDRGDYSAAAAECHRAHQHRLQAAALSHALSVLWP
jgi:hypothetical protein